MKTTKTLIALLLTLALVMALAVTASADVPANLNGHTFKLYQVFSGTQSAATTPKLADVTWGNGVNSSALLQALANTAPFNQTETNPPHAHVAITTGSSAEDVAKVLSVYADDDAVAVEFSKLAYNARIAGAAIEYPLPANTTLPAGYYLVVDETPASTADATVNFVYNMQLLQLTEKGTFDIRVKAEYPTIEKKVQDKNDSSGATSEWQDSADYDIGDSVPYRLQVTLPNMDRYTTYAIEITDTLDAGLTPPTDTSAITVYIGNTQVTNSNIVKSISGQTITVSCENIKAQGLASNGDVITVYFNAVLNDQAVIGARGNDNKVQLKYSNNPNDSNSRGKTPEDLVRVFTYRIVVNKVDNNQQPLTGADFELYKQLPDTTSPTNTKWVKVTELNGANNTNPTKEKSSSNNVADCIFTFKGLDDGHYKIVEENTPNGYNTISDIEFDVVAGHATPSNSPTLDSLEAQNITPAGTTISNPNQASGELGTLATTVVNQPGVVLPETGDEGTQMLYIVGTALLLGGLVLIVTKKRVGEQA